MADKKPETGTTTSAAPAPAAAGGLKAWLPLVVTLVAMPALAYGTMSFLILPKMKASTAASAGANGEHTASGESEPHAEGADADAPGGSASGGPGTTTTRKTKIMVTLDKLVVNVAGTMGTRYLMASVTVVGSSSKFKNTIEDNMPQLKDLAASTLAGKSIADLEKPGARNLIKTELISVFNNALGESLVKEIYLPEMAIQ
jgi:flagellar FliL protein